MGSLSTRFEATLERGTESQFEQNVARLRLTRSDEGFSEAALTLLKHRNPRELKTSAIDDATFDLHAPLRGRQVKSLRPAIV